VLGERYRLLTTLGTGGVATVWLARDLVTSERVAVKLLHAHLTEDAEVRERFANEGRAARKVQHPNVVRALDDGYHLRAPYLVMEWVDGIPLSRHVAQHGPPPLDLALTLARHAARGLAAMHAAGVVHRDVQPNNLLLVGEAGEPYAIKVSDFGLAHVGADAEQLPAPMGSSDYLAPELVVGEPPDPRTDVYGLGVVMFYLLAGELPFAAPSRAQVLALHLLSSAPPPSWLLADGDPDIDRIVATALRKVPANRYATMTDMLKDIERALGLRQGAPRGAPLSEPNDRYRPSTEHGRRALEQMKRARG